MNDFFTNLGNFYVSYQHLLNIVFIVLGALIVRWILLRSVDRVVKRVVTGVKKKHDAADTQAIIASPVAAVRVVQRTRTMGSVLSNLITWAIMVFAFILILGELQFQVTAIVASAGVLGAALGFGAQNVIKDMLNGLFMVVEDQLGVGDVVDLGPATGVVEAVGIRVTTLRDVNGTLWFVRNGEILRVGNMSQGWSRVIIDLAVPYDTDIDAVQARMLETANDLAESEKWRSRVIERPEIWGLESISAEALVIRLVVKTRTNSKDDVARELRMLLKRALDDMGVHLPSLNSIVLTGFEGAAPRGGTR
ncbi:mechanosensitive ion channel family protein [Subtercola boreus]|uniref:Mechanosensitive ion channel protein MscS n=1 Tax=Subtercola boreus TaxID=120213 RepID=A0A3E0WE21_9MICO|nr:mechanosensitive ion channel family protein [Subtercola boreus]RFA22107.1 mechanosensitive ion channel protein MscS [Subtercola boreus]RFA22287.1 mechanosensitive ion channel protein MscS [Subtercola boreus]RFA28150.1 mechanosensitive ion channel protein MscS [Subtercola boreus]